MRHTPLDEVSNEKAMQAVRTLIDYVGDNPDREGLTDTPGRVVRAMWEMFGGYNQDPLELFTTFEAGYYDQMVLVKGIEFTSFCEHHMLPFTGVAHVGYIPNSGRIIGLSKVARLVDVYAKRLQVQERLTNDVGISMMVGLEPKGVGVVIEARHMCMMCRGVRKQQATMVTSYLRGCMLGEPEARAEFFAMIKG